MIQKIIHTITLSRWDSKSLAFCCLGTETALNQICWRPPLPKCPHSCKRRSRSIFSCPEHLSGLNEVILMSEESSSQMLSWDLQHATMLVSNLSNCQLSDHHTRWKWAHIFESPQDLCIWITYLTRGFCPEYTKCKKRKKRNYIIQIMFLVESQFDFFSF